jgi:hypothetical protein
MVYLGFLWCGLGEHRRLFAAFLSKRHIWAKNFLLQKAHPLAGPSVRATDKYYWHFPFPGNLNSVKECEADLWASTRVSG